MTSYKDKNVTMHRAVCSACHKHCEVPFKPDGNKPVFCDTCFAAARVTSDREYVKRKDKMIFDRDDSSKDFVSIQTDTATLSPSDTKFAELKREISSANAKLDKLIDLMSKLSPKKIERKEE